MNSTTKAHCMKCKSEWDREFTQKILVNHILIKNIIIIVKIFYLKRRKARFPETNASCNEV